MTTVQLAISDSNYAQSLRSLLLRDGTHRVLLVHQPDLKLDGVVVMEGKGIENLSMLGSQPERFVIITKKDGDLKRIWDAGVWHVVFADDSPNTAQLAVIAAELRLITGPVRSPAGAEAAVGTQIAARRLRKSRELPSPNNSTQELSSPRS